MENLAHYIIRASFSQERMTYLLEESWPIFCLSLLEDSEEYKWKLPIHAHATVK